jgi:hypothetical protein
MLGSTQQLQAECRELASVLGVPGIDDAMGDGHRAIRRNHFLRMLSWNIPLAAGIAEWRHQLRERAHVHPGRPDRVAICLFFAFYAAMALAALNVEVLFGFAGLIPHERHA